MAAAAGDLVGHSTATRVEDAVAARVLHVASCSRTPTKSVMNVAPARCATFKRNLPELVII